ncbi:hypothetical protein NQZ68_014163 [Dissostichus eleginoides]|nr:hypothetical protein NQZ68_014163 [Dissostichus eleginoides]
MQGEICLSVVTGEGFLCLEPGSGACLGKIEALFLLGERKGVKGGESRGGDKMWRGGRGASKERDPQRCAGVTTISDSQQTQKHLIRVETPHIETHFIVRQ